MPDTVFIYALNCPITGRTRYVGKANNPEKRFLTHLCYTKKNRRGNWIQSLLDKGQKPLLEILDEVDVSHWPQWEVAYIQFFRDEGFDLVNGNAGGEGGIDPAPEARAKMRAARLGTKASDATRAKLSIISYNMPDEQRAKLSVTQTGKKHTPEARAKISAAGLGRKHTLEARARMSIVQKGENNPRFGKKASLETRAKMRDAQIKRRQNEKKV